MPSGIKYSTTNPTGGIRKGNVGIGVEGNLGPTSTSGLYSNVTAFSEGTYIIVELTGAGAQPRFYAPPDNTSLIRLANSKGAGVTTADGALVWFAGQSNFLINATAEYPNIVTGGLTTYLDATIPSSYPNSGTTWYDLSGNGNNGTFNIGSPSFSDFGGKRSIWFDNPNKTVYQGNHEGFILNSNPGISAAGTSFTFEAWFYQLSADQGGTVILSNAGGCDGYRWGPNGTYAYWLLGNADCSQYSEGTIGNTSGTMIGRWVQMVGVFDRANELGGGSKFYHFIDGVKQGDVGTFNPTIQLNAPGIAYCCGAFDGYLSVVRVYSKALTTAQITQNFNAQKSYFGL
jgi:hypothetical protein